MNLTKCILKQLFSLNNITAGRKYAKLLGNIIFYLIKYFYFHFKSLKADKCNFLCVGI